VNLAGAFDSLSNRRVILFGGKGGVGKTTVSALAALHYAQKRKVILFTTDPASNLRDLFPSNPATRQPGNLVIEELDAEKLYAHFLQKNLDFLLEIGDRGTYLDRDELRRFFELSVPGVDEIMAWLRIGELAEENAESLIVVDTAPTGHALRMLAAGVHVRQFAAALDALEEKHRGMVRQLTRRDARDKVDEFIDNFERDARRRHDLLTNPATSSFVPVFLSEPWVVEQTIRLIQEVRDGGIDVPLSVLNRAVGKPDCDLCRKRQKREAAARKRLAPLPVVESLRSCVPMDSLEALSAHRG
jgi:arsenite/tail-anchored protein-transporting ATPase